MRPLSQIYHSIEFKMLLYIEKNAMLPPCLPGEGILLDRMFYR